MQTGFWHRKDFRPEIEIASHPENIYIASNLERVDLRARLLSYV